MNQIVSLSVPQTQNTAPVLEFRCLWTQDVRRKAQKRWQDGRLKFHTFNKRIMVYDERSNAVGNMHWQKDREFGEGEQLSMDVIEVQVEDCIGKRDQDLTELVDKRVKDKEDRARAKAGSATPIRNQASSSGELIRPKSLNAVIGTPTGHYGRAMVSNVSPFEQKHHAPDENVRPTKRIKQSDLIVNRGGYAQNLMGATLNLGGSQRVGSTANIRYEPFKSSIHRPQPISIDLTKDDEQDNRTTLREIREKRQERSPARSQKRKHLRSPPQRSNYASNLTGAALSLAPTPRREVNSSFVGENSTTLASVDDIPKPKPAKKKQPKLSVNRTISSSAGETLISSGNTALASRKMKASKKHAELPPASRLDLSRNANKENSSPSTGSAEELPLPIPADKPVSMLRIKPRLPRKLMMNSDPSPITKSPSPAIIDEIQVTNSSLAHSNAPETSSHKSTSTLRIKSRPRPKMMMLMGRPSASNSSGSSKSSGKDLQSADEFGGILGSLKSDIASNNHAEVHLSNKNTNSIRALFNDRRPSIHLEDLSSSLEDRGIDHQTIDALLSRKKPQDAVQKPIVPAMNQQTPLVRTKQTVNSTIVNRSMSSPPIDNGEKGSTSNFNIPEPERAEDPQSKLQAPRLDLHRANTKLDCQQTSNVGEVTLLNKSMHQTVKDHGDIDRENHAQSLKEKNTSLLKPKIANPATRGQSVQVMAKKTMEQATSGFTKAHKDMLPPVIPNVSHLRRALQKDATEASKPSSIDDGPWSRESFDLFGTWRPPGRDSTVNS